MRSSRTFWFKVVDWSLDLGPVTLHWGPLFWSLVKLSFGEEIVSLPNWFRPFARRELLLWLLIEVALRSEVIDRPFNICPFSLQGGALLWSLVKLAFRIKIVSLSNWFRPFPSHVNFVRCFIEFP